MLDFGLFLAWFKQPKRIIVLFFHFHIRVFMHTLVFKMNSILIDTTKAFLSVKIQIQEFNKKV